MTQIYDVNKFILKRLVIFLIGPLLTLSCQNKNTASDEQPVISEDGGVVTTIYMVRHAEKVQDGSSNPVLTKDGMSRANKLSEILKDKNITAIFSTPYKRTTATAKPTSIGQNKVVQMYNPADPNGFLEHALKQYGGGNILIVGHSNTLPTMLNILAKTNTYKDLDDDEYDKLFILTVPYQGAARVEVQTY